MSSDSTRRAVTGGIGAMLAAGPALAAPAGKVRIEGSPPWFPNLATVMDRDPALLDQLATEFAPVAAALATPDVYWHIFNYWMSDRVAAAVIAGQADQLDLRREIWPIFATGYWTSLENQKHYGVPIGVQKLGYKAKAPEAKDLQGFVDKLALRQAALAGGGEACLRLLPALLREEPVSGLLHGMAYNAGFIITVAEDRPLGHRPKHLKMETGLLRANPRDFLRVDYATPAPDYLKVWRTAYENAVSAKPEAFEQVLKGQAGQKDLRAIWAQGVGWGRTNWGGGAIDNWTQPYYDEDVRWSVRLNFSYEAAALASFVALLNQDPVAARRAVLANSLHLGVAAAAVMGLLDTGGMMPKVVRS